jgi:hypothetical protein
MDFVWNYEIFSKTTGYHKSMALFGIPYIYLPVYMCLGVVGFKALCKKGLCSSLGSSFSHLAWAFFMQKCTCRSGPLTPGPNLFTHQKGPSLASRTSWTLDIGLLNIARFDLNFMDGTQAS